MLNRSNVLMLAAGILIGSLVVAPVAATGDSETTQLWNKLKPLADKRYYTKKASNARYYTKAQVDAKVAPSTQIYGYVQHGPPPTLVPEATQGFTAVSTINTGIYCLTPENPSIDPMTRPLIATVEFEFSADSDLTASAIYDSGICPTGQFGVITQANGTDSNDISFFVFVP